MFFWTAEPMTAQGPRKGEPSLRSMRKGFRTQPRALSPRQLPTDHVHAVPTREYQSDPSSRMLLRCHRPCCPKQNLLKAHQRERVPATPPVDSPAMIVIATGGSGGNTSRPVAHVKNKSKKSQARTRLDRVAPYQKANLVPSCTVLGPRAPP